MKRKLICILLICMFTGSSTPVFAASIPMYRDVPSNFWASEAIEALSSGGLMNGYGGGYFGPNDTFNIDQMATVVCSAKGYAASTQNGYWGYGAVDYCLNTLKCLPNFGAVSKENYSKACSRELAIYMLMKGLGPQSDKNYRTVEPTAIPDYGDITMSYREEILKAYCYGITNGIDSKGTFSPKSNLTRAQIATMLYRAGYTTAATKPVEQPVTMTNPQLFEKIKAMGIWNYSELNSCKNLTAKAAKYGGLQVSYSSSSGLLYISTPEQNREAWFDNSGNIIDVNGKVVSDPLNSKGIMVTSTGFGYEARQLLLSVLKIVYPNDYQKAYEASKTTFMEKAFEYGGSEYASTIRWYDGRMWISFLTPYPARTFEVMIGDANDIEMYNRSKAEVSTGMQRDFAWAVGGAEKGAVAYEFNRW